MRVIVTMKQVLDPEAPPSLLTVAPCGFEVSGRGVGPRLDPYSMHALAAALELRNAGHPVHIHVVGVGPSPSRNLYLWALASGADRVSLLDTVSDPVAFGDAWATASLLDALIRTVAPEGFDLVLCGRRAADTNAGAVGAALAALLEVPVLSLARSVQVDRAAGDNSGRVVVDQLSDIGANRLACPMPAVVTVSHEVGEVESVPFAKVVEAKKMPFEVLSRSDVCGSGILDPMPATPTLLGMHARDDRRSCELIADPDSREAGRILARRIRGN